MDRFPQCYDRNYNRQIKEIREYSNFYMKKIRKLKKFLYSHDTVNADIIINTISGGIRDYIRLKVDI